MQYIRHSDRAKCAHPAVHQHRSAIPCSPRPHWVGNLQHLPANPSITTICIWLAPPKKTVGLRALLPTCAACCARCARRRHCPPLPILFKGGLCCRFAAAFLAVLPAAVSRFTAASAIAAATAVLACHQPQTVLLGNDVFVTCGPSISVQTCSQQLDCCLRYSCCSRLPLLLLYPAIAFVAAAKV